MPRKPQKPEPKLGRRDLSEFARWLKDDGAEQKTVRTYVNAAGLALELFPEEPWRILESLKLAKRSKVTYRAALKRYAQWREDDALLETLDSRAVGKLLTTRGGKPPRQVKALEEGEVGALLAVLEDYRDQEPAWIWPCFNLMVKLGLRANVDLTWITREAIAEALRNETTLTIITKGGRERDLPISVVLPELEALHAIQGWTTVADLVAPQSAGPRRHDAAYEAIRRFLKQIAEEAGLDATEVHTHRLRHAAAHWLLKETGDIFLVRDLLGHRSVKTTENYLRSSRVEEIADALSKRFER